MKLLSIFSSLVVSTNILAQYGPINASDGIVNGVYITENIPTKKMIPYEFVREADVIWSKRVWQTIDLREKMNHSLYFPLDNYDSRSNWVKNSSRWSLWTILKTHVLNGDLRVFSPYNPQQFTIVDGDDLKYPIDPIPGKNYYTDSNFRSEIFSCLGRLGPIPTLGRIDDNGEPIMILDKDGNLVPDYPPRDTSWFLSEDIIQYRLKEDWFMDKERGVMDVRIIAIAPVIYDKDDSGQIIGTRELFWLYFPHCRFVLNNYYAFNSKNDAQWMSFDDLFWKRKFSSSIYKESNVYDREIGTYKTGIDALFEADKIKEEVRTIEHDVWSF